MHEMMVDGVPMSSILSGNFLDQCIANSANLAAWTGAIGTIAALIGTIFIATSERRKRDRVENNLAILAVMRSRKKVLFAQVTCQGICKSCEDAIKDRELPPFGFWADELRHVVSRIPEELLPLVAFPGHVAYELSFAIELIEYAAWICDSSYADPEACAFIYTNTLPVLASKLKEADKKCSHCLKILMSKVPILE
jgi:hypothetical protein